MYVAIEGHHGRNADGRIYHEHEKDWARVRGFTVVLPLECGLLAAAVQQQQKRLLQAGGRRQQHALVPTSEHGFDWTVSFVVL